MDRNLIAGLFAIVVGIGLLALAFADAVSAGFLWGALGFAAVAFGGWIIFSTRQGSGKHSG